MIAGSTIRPCQPHDFDAVLSLLRQLWPDKQLDAGALREVFDRALQSDAQVYLCATDGDQVLGFVSLTVKNNLWQAANLGHIDELVVDEQHRGRGLGKKLLDAIIVQARQKNCARVELDSAFHRREAHSFYEKHHFANRAILFSKILK